MNGVDARAVLDALPLAACAFDAGQRLVLVNAPFFELGGLDPSVLQPGATLEQTVRLLAFRGLYGPGDPEEQVAAALRLDRRQPSRRLVNSLRGRWFEIASTPFPGGGFISCAHAVTAIIRSEVEARDRAEKLEAVLARLGAGVALHDEAQRLVLHNRSYEGMIGAPPEMLADRPGLSALLGRLETSGELPDAAARDELLAALTGHGLAGRPAQRVRPNGRVIRFDRAAMPGGGFVVEASDITELKRAEDEARRRATVLDAAIEALPHGVCIYGPDRRVVTFNRAYEIVMEGVAATPGEHLADVVRRRAEAGEYGPGDLQEIVRIQLGFPLNRPQARQRLRPNGTAIDVRTAPLPDGGHIAVVTDITAIFRADEESRRRATILETMLETMRHGIMLFGPDRRLVAANALAARLSGHEAAELQPGRLYDDLQRLLYLRQALGTPSEAALLLQDSLSVDRSQPVRHTQRGPDGRMLEVASDPTPDGGFVITHVDITPLASAEEEAQRRADLLRSMLENMRYGVLLFGPDRRLIAANALASRLTGLPPGTYRIGRTLDEMMAEASQARYLDPEHIERIVGADRRQSVSYRRTRPDGIVLEITSDPTPDGGFVVVLTDVTKLHAAEREAERRTRLMQVMLENIRHGVCLFDGEGRVVACNALAIELSGLTAEEMRPGVSIETLRQIQAARGEYGPPEETERMLRDRGANQWTLPSRYVRRRGNGRVLEIRTDAAPDGGFIRTYTDVTDDHHIRAELEAATDAAESANRAKSRFLATMNHELRTPLNAIVGFSETLLKGGRTPAETAEFARAINEAGQHLRALIEDILDVARAETDRYGVALGTVPAIAIAEEAGRMMQGAMEAAGIAFLVEVDPSTPPVRADSRRLRQILLNLLSNATKFTPRGGTVTLSVAREDDGRIAFRISDTGIGMAETEIAHAFEAFTQLDDGPSRRYEGSGIGLHLARVLAEAQGGNLAIQSQLKKGTVAILHLPAAEETNPPSTRTAGADA